LPHGGSGNLNNISLTRIPLPFLEIPMQKILSLSC
jgi:hypothetical protein